MGIALGENWREKAMADPAPYTREDKAAQPPLSFADFKASVVRAPTKPLVRAPHTLTEVTGTNWCQRTADGPVDYRFWVAAIDAPKPLHFRVGGAADLLDPWRADFISMLQSLSLK